MLLLSQIKVKPGYKQEDLIKRAASLLKVSTDDILSLRIDRRSIDARKNEIFYVFSLCVLVKNESNVYKRVKDNNVTIYTPVEYKVPECGNEELLHAPVVVGAGPAGLFAAYFLALRGYKPLLLERGFDVDTRTNDVESFWENGVLNPNSNVLFGEGGAGTFSDGKLNTLVKDKEGRNKAVLELFTKFGADPSILYDSKPHIGTDVLKTVVKNMREAIKNLGGIISFNACLTDISFDSNNHVSSITVNNTVKIPCEVCILCIGHSARDTFKMLYDKGIYLEQKDFAVGFRIEHKQDLINKALYSDDKEICKKLPPASYKLTHKCENGRGVYSFCMCPGGYVVNASSEEGYLCVNGMSYSKRNGENANSAIVVTVGKEDYSSESPLAGIEFQRKIEKAAYDAGNGNIPISYYKDFKNKVLNNLDLDVPVLDTSKKTFPNCKGVYSFSDLSKILPKELNENIIEGIEYFDRIIPGFSDDYSVLSGIESRTSSPVRITRNEYFESISHFGIYPCGEGAGYAGGITSAAMDGIKAFEAVSKKYKPLDLGE